MAGCLCRPWAEASQREIKNGKSSLKTKGVEIKLFALSSSLVLQLAIDSGEALLEQCSIRRSDGSGRRVSTKLIPMMVPFWEFNNQRNIVLGPAFC
jgi:hypothetical protein